MLTVPLENFTKVRSQAWQLLTANLLGQPGGEQKALLWCAPCGCAAAIVLSLWELTDSLPAGLPLLYMYRGSLAYRNSAQQSQAMFRTER